jgi:ubiquinone/menaquinone biosynthesis C-methylase UbiE
MTGASSRHGAVRRAYDATYGRLFAALYDRMLARDEQRWLGDTRRRLLGEARGRTLELGAGTGLNAAHYPDAVEALTLTEPFGPMADRLRERYERLRPELGADVIETPAERLPFDSGRYDTVVSTLVLCTVEDPEATLAEVARVLRPGGSLLFFEHVRATEPSLAKWQDRLHGPWFAFGHGCHCNRDTLAAIERSPLEVERVVRDRSPSPAIVSPTIEGRAVLPGG